MSTRSSASYYQFTSGILWVCCFGVSLLILNGCFSDPLDVGATCNAATCNDGVRTHNDFGVPCGDAATAPETYACQDEEWAGDNSASEIDEAYGVPDGTVGVPYWAEDESSDRDGYCYYESSESAYYEPCDDGQWPGAGVNPDDPRYNPENPNNIPGSDGGEHGGSSPNITWPAPEPTPTPTPSDPSDPSSDSSEPSGDLSEPTTDLSEPATVSSDPSSDSSEPSSDSADSSGDSSEPSSDSADSSGDSSEPSSDSADSSGDSSEPSSDSADSSEPSSDSADSSGDSSEPSSDSTDPSADSSEPSGDSTEPEPLPTRLEESFVGSSTLDIMLTLDRSGSMKNCTDPNDATCLYLAEFPNGKWNAANEAISTFLNESEAQKILHRERKTHAQV